MKKDIICKCGHSKRFHKECGPPIGEEWCEGKGLPKNVGYGNNCQCWAYKPDNLLHIETLAKKRKLI